MRQTTTSVYHPNGNGSVEGINHTTAQVLAIVVNQRQDDSHIHLSHVDFAYNNSADRLARNEVHMNRIPHLPLTTFEHDDARGQQRLAHDHLEYCDLAAERPRRTAPHVERRNSALPNSLKHPPSYTVGGWVWTHNTSATIPQGAKAGTDAKALKAKLSLHWTGPFKIFAVGPFPSNSTPDGRPLIVKLLYLGLHNDMPGADTHRRVSVARCKSCANPLDTVGLPRYLPAGLTQNALTNYTTNLPLFHVTEDDVSVPVERLEIDKISSHRSVRGRGGVIAVLYKKHWKGLLRPSWERESDLLHSRQHVLEYWGGAPLQLRQVNRVCRRMHVGAARRELARDKGARVLPPGHSYINHETWTRGFSGTILPVDAFFGYKGQYRLWWLGKISVFFNSV